MSTTLKIRVSDEPVNVGVFSLARKGPEPRRNAFVLVIESIRRL